RRAAREQHGLGDLAAEHFLERLPHLLRSSLSMTATVIPDLFAERRARVRAFMEEFVYPNEQANEREDDAALALIVELRQEAKDAGLWAPHLPPEAGGTGNGFLEYAYLNEEIGRSAYAQLILGCQAPDA